MTQTPHYEVTVIWPDGTITTDHTWEPGYQETYKVTACYPGCAFVIKFLGRVESP